MMIFRPTLILLLIAHLALAALADQLVDNVTEAENQARAVLGFVLEAPRAETATAQEADNARQSLRDLISSLVAFKAALLRGDGSDAAAYDAVRVRQTGWLTMRETLQYSQTEREFLGRMDDVMAIVDQDVADR
jgi:hypothetical protein